MKNFYAAVIDGYQYHEISEKRYKNFIDFAIEQWGEDLITSLSAFLEGDKDKFDNLDWQDFFDDYFGYTTYYFALNENNEELKDLEEKNITLKNFIINNNLI